MAFSFTDPGFLGLLGGIGSGLLAAGAGGQPIGSRGLALSRLPQLALQGMQQGLLTARLQQQMQNEEATRRLWQEAFGGAGAGGAAGAAAGMLGGSPPGAASPGAGAPGAPSPSLSPAAEALRGAIPQNLLPVFGALGPQQGMAVLGRMLTQQPQTHVLSDEAVLVDNQGRILAQAPRKRKLLDPEEFAQQAALRQLGAARTNVNVRLPPMEQAFAQTTGQGLGKEALEVAAAGAKAADNLRNLQRFEAALERFPTGAAANTRLTIGQWAQQLGIPDSMLPQGLNRQATASAEEMRALTGQMLRDAIGPGGFPAQNFSNADREMLERSLASIGNTPEGNRQIIQNLRAAEQRNLEVAQALRDWMMKHGTTAESYLAFQQQVLPQIRERNLFAPAQPAPAPSQPTARAQDATQARRQQAQQVIQQLRAQHPDWTDDQIVAEARRQVWGQ